MAAIDQLVVVEPHENFAHRPRQLRAQRVGRARPIGARANAAQLLQNLTASERDEFLDPIDERVAAEIIARLAFDGELSLDDVLRCDAGVVGAGHPERFVAGHAAPADEDVLYRAVEPVTHMQHRRNVGRRDHNRERVARAASAR
jgi:hypothetical protein